MKDAAMLLNETLQGLLGPSHMSDVIAKIGLAVATQDIRDFDCRSVEGSSGAGHC
jgi:hypothetical protein